MAKPLYARVFETLLDRIASGELGPGAMLPSEMELAKELDVSQGTARKALMMLEQDGVVQRQQGRGTFVTARTPEALLFNFFRLRNLDGGLETPELVKETIKRRRATAAERDLLEGRPQTVFEIARLRSLAGVAVVHESSTVPTELFPGLMERAPLPNALYVFYQRAYSCAVMKAEEKLAAIGASAEVAQVLGVDEGAPVLEVERIAYDLKRRAVERRVSVSLTQRHRYNVTLS